MSSREPPPRRSSVAALNPIRACRDGPPRRRPRRRRRAGGIGDRDPSRPERCAACFSPIGRSFPRDKACGGGVTGRALRQVPCDITPVVERVVDTFELRLHHRRSFRRTSAEPLILMTQRRQLDAYLAEQAVAAGARFRDGTKVEHIVIGERRRHRPASAARASPPTSSSAPTARTASSRRPQGSTPASSAASRSRATFPGRCSIETRYASTAVVEIGAPAGGYGWLFPKGDHANLGVGGWASEGPSLRDHLARLARAYDVDPDAITDLRGHRLPMRRIGASTPASSAGHPRR